MKFIISESAGRSQAWFDNLDRKQQKAYLEKHPHSKFGKKATKPTSNSKLVARPIVDTKKLTFKNKLDALRQRLATARPEDIQGIRLQIKKVREQIAASNNPTYTHALLSDGKFGIKKNGKHLMTFTPSQHTSTVKGLDESRHPGLKEHLSAMMKDGALQKQRAQEKLQKNRNR